jgi:hypothetical protein
MENQDVQFEQTTKDNKFAEYLKQNIIELTEEERHEQNILLSEIRNTIQNYKLKLKQKNIPIEIYTKVCEDLNLPVFVDPGVKLNCCLKSDEKRYRTYSYNINRGIAIEAPKKLIEESINSTS